MSGKSIICYLADRHDLYDDRIYWKMAVPMVGRGFEVHYLLIGPKDEQGISNEGVHYTMFKLKTFAQNRFVNFFLKRLNPKNNYRRMFDQAKLLEADIYHFHDLWINRLGPKFKKLSHKPVVIYDAREPYAEDYRSYVKSSVPLVVATFASWVDRWEKKRASNYDLVIANEDNVRVNFAHHIGEEKSIVLYNYADTIIAAKDHDLKQKKYDLIYCGAVSEIRGAIEMVKGIQKASDDLPDIKAIFIGNYYPKSFKEELQQMIDKHGLKEQIELHDAVPYTKVGGFYAQSKIGLVLLKKVETFELSMPIKLFEYMAHGLPIIASNFGHMKTYIEKDACGVTVDPTNDEEVASAIVKLLTDKDLFSQLSDMGRSAAQTKYRWEIEFEKLVGHYKTKLDARG
ncbi:glycosyltransferase family 4 protein [Lutimonas sp.]|uniref:glycosyltransferase family 4 protein n=1 Tax=Lutimonas sp. TaxID=1872403 RepID=UPI003D9AFF3B